MFTATTSVEAVRNGPGNQYYVDPDGVLTFRIVQTPKDFMGRPEWFIPSRTDPGRDGIGQAVERFERAGVYLPKSTYGPEYSLEAENCGGTGAYCGTAPSYNPDVCPNGYQQVAYDKCCAGNDCVFASDMVQFNSLKDLSSDDTSACAPTAVSTLVALVGMLMTGAVLPF